MIFISAFFLCYLVLVFEMIFSTYWSAVGTRYQNRLSSASRISKKYQHGKRLTPYRYYGDYKNNEHIFLLLSIEQYLINKEDSSVKNGNLVYQDEYYVVFDYPSHEAFKESFDK